MNKEFIKRFISSLVIVPITFFFILKGSIYFLFFIFLLFFITLYEWHLLSSKRKYYFPGIIFIIFSFYTFYFFRNETDIKIFLLILLTCVFTDIGGYVFGKIFKGPKLTKISPNKTYSGMIGSLVSSILLTYIYLNNLNFFDDFKANNEFGNELFIVVILISLISQAGDLIISFFKRKSKIKNTGKIIPGHGGLLDRIDGMIFAFPFMFLLIQILQ